MNRFIVVVPDERLENRMADFGIRLLPANGREWNTVVAIPFPRDDEETRVDDVRSWRCSEEEVNAVVEHMTQKFPGQDVHVYELKSLSTRPVGEVQTRQVTKDGILP